MKQNTVTIEQVRDNMQDVMIRTVEEFGKPTTYVTVKMKNGFTIRESTTCVDPSNYNEEIGTQICLRKLEDKVWFLLGYQLQNELVNPHFNEKEVYEAAYKVGFNNGVKAGIENVFGKFSDFLQGFDKHTDVI